MKKLALSWIVAVGVVASNPVAAEPLSDLQTQLAALRSDQPIRIKVKVELEHTGRAPLHLNDTKKRGTAVISYGPKGARVRTQRWTGSSSQFSIWRSAKGGGEGEIPLVDDIEAGDLADPARMLEALLSEATLLSDESATWQDQPARVLVIRPGPLAANRKDGTADPTPFPLEAKIWLNESGVPLALERSIEIRLPGLAVVEQQSLTFQQVGDRFLVAESHETYSGSALGALRGRDTKTMKVSVAE